MPSKALVVDANILVRAVLGKRVRAVIEAHAESASFFVPEVSYTEAEEHLATLVARPRPHVSTAVTMFGEWPAGRSLRSKMTWNAKTTNLVLRKLVWLAALWNLNQPRG